VPPTARIGMLTPSSNTVLEPTTVAMLSGLPDVTLHFASFKVTEIALSDEALGHFDNTEILRAAELLSDAKVDIIAWNATSASWLGFDRDEQLCEQIEALTGARACTSVLAMRILNEQNVRRLGFVTPYTSDVQKRIIRNWAAAGVTCTAERHLGLSNTSRSKKWTSGAWLSWSGRWLAKAARGSLFASQLFSETVRPGMRGSVR
jgi:maleate isomerase